MGFAEKWIGHTTDVAKSVLIKSPIKSPLLLPRKNPVKLINDLITFNSGLFSRVLYEDILVLVNQAFEWGGSNKK